MLKDLTLYVPVRDRQHNLGPLIRYYKDFDCKKIIFDSSKKQYNKVERLKEFGFEYIYTGPISYWDKIKIISDNIDTRYAVDNPDDDIAIKSSLIKCIDFMDSNSDYSCCFGEIYSFIGKKIFPAVPRKHQGGLALNFRNSSAFKRIDAFLTKCPIAINHAFFRSDVIKGFFNFVNSNTEVQRVNFLERFFIIYAMIYGNWKVLPVLYQMRNKSNDHVYKHVSDMHIDKALERSLNMTSLGPLSKVLAKETAVSGQECFDFIKSKLTEHFEHKKRFGADWCRVDFKPIVRDYDDDIKEFRDNYLQ